MASRDRVALSKSRAERSRPPTVPVPQVEIVPGRLSEGEWLSLLCFEEAEDVVGDVLAGLLDQVLEECYEVYLARQCIPYVINQAREAMLQIIEWRFLVRDEGEANVPAQPTWQEDEEPVACITDSWAQGSVPVLQAMLSPEEEEVSLAEFLAPESPVPDEASEGVDAAQLPTGSGLWEEKPSQKPLQEARPAKSHSGRVVVKLEEERPSPAPVPPRKAGLAHPSYYGPTRAARLDRGMRPLDDLEKALLLRELSQVPLEEEEVQVLPPSCSNLLRIQLGRPPNIKDVFYDQSGHISLVPPLDPARLPKRWIKPCVEAVDPDVESRRQAALKTVSGRCKQRQHPKPPRLGADTVGPSSPPPHRLPQVVLWDESARKLPKLLAEQAVPQPPLPGRILEPTRLVFVKPTLLWEPLELAPGVTLKGRGTASQSAKAAVQHQEEERAHGNLQPICPQLPFHVSR